MYALPSSLGQQSLSRNRTLPKWSFGASKRPSLAGPRSQESGIAPDRYTLHGAFGAQSLSRRPSSPSAGFGVGERSTVKSRPGVAPNAYALPPSLGSRVPDRPGSPAFSLGARWRAGRRAAASGAPPKDYNAPASFGRQASSRRPTSPSWSFGSGRRSGSRRRVPPVARPPSPRRSTRCAVAAEVGRRRGPPSAAAAAAGRAQRTRPPSSFGRQAVSRWKTAASYSFGSP